MKTDRDKKIAFVHRLGFECAHTCDAVYQNGPLARLLKGVGKIGRNRKRAAKSRNPDHVRLVSLKSKAVLQLVLMYRICKVPQRKASGFHEFQQHCVWLRCAVLAIILFEAAHAITVTDAGMPREEVILEKTLHCAGAVNAQHFSEANHGRRLCATPFGNDYRRSPEQRYWASPGRTCRFPA